MAFKLIEERSMTKCESFMVGRWGEFKRTRSECLTSKGLLDSVF
jgi:hypothetical protein